MSDAQLRNLERKATDGGAEEQAALLRYRIRSNTLDRKIIDLAAYLGDEAALIVQDNWILSDHIAGICPCGDCKLWDGGLRDWIVGMGFWIERLSLNEEERTSLADLVAKAISDSGFEYTSDLFSKTPEQIRGMSDAVEEAAVPWLFAR